MLNRYTANRVLKSWVENFVDEDSGEVVSIERNEVLFEKGILINQDILSQIRFHMESGEIKEIEVSNQRRIAYCQESTCLFPHMAIVEMNRKKYKFLFYANGIDNAILILNDYIELNYTSPFFIKEIKDYRADIILIDNLKAVKPAEADTDTENENSSDSEKKFYHIEFSIEVDGEYYTASIAVVHTFTVDRAMMLINDYLIKKERKRSEEKNEPERVFTTMIELAKPTSIHVYIPEEFSEAYNRYEYEQ
ncbi:RNA polymerase subunit sigma [Paludibacter sp. 221]|nr:RNA polymerase subunit sigma [Paludibacter sp. 221]